jgi:hypothetical protein
MPITEDLSTALGEAQAIHAGVATGYFALFTKTGKHTRPMQRMYPMSKLAKVLESIEGNSDTYISQNSFVSWNSRKVSGLSKMGCAFVDIDCYKQNIVVGPDAVELALECTRAANFPDPSYIVSSGRGMYCKWLFDKPLSASKLNQWQFLELFLIPLFKSMGVDAQVKDASRVLRVMGTTNGSAEGASVKLLYSSNKRYDFDALCEAARKVDPEAFSEAAQLIKVKAAKLERKAQKDQLLLSEVGPTDIVRGSDDQAKLGKLDAADCMGAMKAQSGSSNIHAKDPVDGHEIQERTVSPEAESSAVSVMAPDATDALTAPLVRRQPGMDVTEMLALMDKTADAFYAYSDSRSHRMREICNQECSYTSNGLSKGTLNWSRFLDMRDLCVLRGGGRIGQRTSFLFWMGNYLMLCGVITTANVESELTELCKSFEGFGDDFNPITDGSFQTVIEKLKMHAAGELVEFEGVEYSPLYTPRNDTLIAMFQISDVEQTWLRTIISESEHKIRRDGRFPGRAARRETRLQWRFDARILANQMVERGEKLNISQIARRVGADRTIVSKWLSSPDSLDLSNLRALLNDACFFSENSIQLVMDGDRSHIAKHALRMDYEDLYVCDDDDVDGQDRDRDRNDDGDRNGDDEPVLEWLRADFWLNTTQELLGDASQPGSYFSVKGGAYESAFFYPAGDQGGSLKEMGSDFSSDFRLNCAGNSLAWGGDGERERKEGERNGVGSIGKHSVGSFDYFNQIAPSSFGNLIGIQDAECKKVHAKKFAEGSNESKATPVPLSVSVPPSGNPFARGLRLKRAVGNDSVADNAINFADKNPVQQSSKEAPLAQRDYKSSEPAIEPSKLHVYSKFVRVPISAERLAELDRLEREKVAIYMAKVNAEKLAARKIVEERMRLENIEDGLKLREKFPRLFNRF